MTDRKAIEYICGNITIDENSPVAKEMGDAIKTAISALQEREERSKGCVYCLDDCCAPLDWEYGLDHILPDYKFCPMCGRKLKGADNG